MRSLWLLHELGCDFETIVHPFGKELRAPEFLALNPVGRVPALELDGAMIWETGAIAEVLCEGFPEAGLGRAPGHPERNDWLIWMHFAETISQHAASLTQQHIVLRDDAMRSPILMRIEAKRIEKCYQALEGQLAGPGGASSILSGGFSAADIGVGQAVYMARHFAAIDAYPALGVWYKQISERPGFRKSLPQPGEARLYSNDFYAPWPDPE